MLSQTGCSFLANLTISIYLLCLIICEDEGRTSDIKCLKIPPPSKFEDNTIYSEILAEYNQICFRKPPVYFLFLENLFISSPNWSKPSRFSLLKMSDSLHLIVELVWFSAVFSSIDFPLCKSGFCPS